MKLLIENWKRYITESMDLANAATDARMAAEDNEEDPKFAVKEVLRDAGYSIIGMGQGRVIIGLDNDKVAKIAYNDNGIQQNKQESVVWNQTNSDLLIPVLESDKLGHYIVVPYAKICGEECEEQIDMKMGAIKKLLAGVGTQSLIDIYNISNWGIHDGQVKLIDYGS